LLYLHAVKNIFTTSDVASGDNHIHQPSAPGLTSCPLCAREFKSLPLFKEKDGRDYSNYLVI